MIKKIMFVLSALTAICLLQKSAISMPLIGDKAPEFTADTTKGVINFPKDFEGKWVVLFSHPGDFTPVCTTEFIAFQKYMPKFSALNTKLLGLSVDNVQHHKEWIKSIKGIEFGGCKDTEITFPIIDDVNKEISKKYGMLQKDSSETKTVRAVFVIDPKSKIRAIIYYPQSTGRYIPELQRLLIALQASDKFDIATPADWLPGDDVIVPLSEELENKTGEELKKEGISKHSPYLFTKKLPKNDICKQLLE